MSTRLKILWGITLLLMLLVSLTACSESDFDPSAVDQCARWERFEKCMAIVPVGPAATKYNDWAEVIETCGQQAYYASMRKRSQIKLECRP